jgi:hypothetical protein
MTHAFTPPIDETKCDRLLVSEPFGDALDAGLRALLVGSPAALGAGRA